MPFSDTFPMWRMWPSKTIFCRVLELGPKHCSQVEHNVQSVGIGCWMCRCKDANFFQFGSYHPAQLEPWGVEDYGWHCGPSHCAPGWIGRFGSWNVHFLVTIRIIGCVYQTLATCRHVPSNLKRWLGIRKGEAVSVVDCCKTSYWSVRETIPVVQLSQEFWLHHPRLLCLLSGKQLNLQRNKLLLL